MTVRRSRLGARLALGLLVLASATAVVLVAESLRAEERSDGPQAGIPAVPDQGPAEGPVARPTDPTSRPTDISAFASLERRIVLFGDTATAHVDVVVDENRVDPDSVRVTAAFTPWEIVGTPRRSRRGAGSTVLLRTTYVLRCLTSPCVPSGQIAPLQFDPTRVTYAEAGRKSATPGSGPLESLRVRWPMLTVYSRFATASFDGRSTLASPWRMDVLTLPAVSYRAAPGLIVGVLGVLGVLFAGIGSGLVYVAWPRRLPAAPPEPAAPPPPDLTPLEQALVLLEDAAKANGAADRRRALELVSLALGGHGDDDLARSARILAWSEEAPEVDDTMDLAVRVRAALDLEQENVDSEVNGRVG